jgi:O-antigen/teichoic acid export membrane protein
MTSTARAFYDSTIWNFVEKLSLYASGLALSMILTRSLGPSDYGLYASLMSIVALVPVAVSLGFDRILNVEVPKLTVQPEGPGRLAYLLRRLMAIRLILSLAVCIAMVLFAGALAAFVHQPGAIGPLRLLAVYAVVVSLGQLLRSLFIGWLRLRIVAMVRIGSDALQIGMVLAALRWGWGLPGVMAAFVCAGTATAVVFLLLASRTTGQPPARFDLGPAYRIGAVAWMVGLLGMFLGKHVDILLMNAFRVPTEQIGFYSLAISLYLLGGFLAMGSGPIAQSVFARLSVHRPDALARAWDGSVKLVSLLTVPVFVFLAWHAESVIGLLYTDAYVGAVPFFRVYTAWLAAYSMLGASYCDPLFYATGKAGAVLKFQLVGGLLNVVFDCILIPRWGALGACVATGMAYLTMGIGQLAIAHRIAGVRPPAFFQAKVLAASVGALAATQLLPGPGAHWPSLLAHGLGYASVALLILYALKPLDASEVNATRGINPLIHRLARWFSRPATVEGVVV